MGNSKDWQLMPMILIARPRDGPGMDLYEGRPTPGNPGCPRTSTIATRPGTGITQPN